MGRTCNANEEKRYTYGSFVGKAEENRPLGRQGGRWVDNIKRFME
jgi:hypothetical protein